MKVQVKYPMLSAPNDGYDENGLWRGMTPVEVAALVERMREQAAQRRILYHWTPSSPPS